MKGYRTLVTNGIVMALSALEFGTDQIVAIEDQTALVAGALALLNIVYRFYTSTKVGEKV